MNNMGKMFPRPVWCICHYLVNIKHLEQGRLNRHRLLHQTVWLHPWKMEYLSRSIDQLKKILKAGFPQMNDLIIGQTLLLFHYIVRENKCIFLHIVPETKTGRGTPVFALSMSRYMQLNTDNTKKQRATFPTLASIFQVY